MDAATVVFLLIGGAGALVLALSLVGAELLHLAHLDLPDFFSVEAVAGFVGALGFAGAITSELLGARTPGAITVAAGVGVLAALPTAYLAVRLSRAARDMRTDATPTRADLVGTLGVVVTPITATGYGEVRVRLGGHPIKVYAKADRPLPAGAEIFVVEAPSETSVVVEPVHPLS
ncbi:NfeD family protein [Asanoa sp. NPDC050611]|uniref:NfeD family protein n=1 Tax=Asanoa sp. NPDC050611 TaxID=3157098 RepID=UPI003402B9E3